MRKKTFYLNGHLKSGMFLMLNVLGGDYKSGAARGDCERSFYPSAILKFDSLPWPIIFTYKLNTVLYDVLYAP